MLVWMRRVLLVLGLLTMWGVLSPESADAAPASSRRNEGTSSQFVSAINSERTSRGLGALAVHNPIAGTSCDWNHHMRDTQTLAHDPGLASDAASAAPDWQRVGENVGVGFDVGGLHQAFMDSPGHRKNILEPSYTHIGVCVDTASDGRLWTTHRFLELGSAPPPPPPTTPPPPPPPPPTAAPTTPPPTVSSTTASSSSSSSTTEPTTTTERASTTSSSEVQVEVAALGNAGRRGAANPVVVALFVFVAFGLAAATFAVGRQREQ